MYKILASDVWGGYLCEITKKNPIEFPHKISCHYIERCALDSVVKYTKILDLRICKQFTWPMAAETTTVNTQRPRDAIWDQGL